MLVPPAGPDRIEEGKGRVGRRLIAPLLAAALVLPGAAVAARKPVTGWTTEKAEAQVKAHVLVPFCKAFAGVAAYATKCKDGKPVGPLLDIGALVRPYAVTCRGLRPIAGGKYTQLACAWEGNNQIGRGNLLVFVVGPTAFRWKSVG